ncbi:MAG TPA: penicillin-binding transpeptidase domain-containing protein, partial [Candidatus Limnocylindria bacterium]
MLARTDSRARAVVLLLLVTVVASAIGARLVWWQIAERDWLATMAMHQLAANEELPAERGEIRDVHGELLATSVELQSVFATPPTVSHPKKAAAVLASILDISEVALRNAFIGDDPWVWVARRVSNADADRIRELDLDGIGMLPETQRVYPVKGIANGTTMAAHVLGFVTESDEEGSEGMTVGRYGIEQGENVLLTGHEGSVSAQEDVGGRQIANSVSVLVEPVDGSDLRLTIDAGIQHLLEQAIWNAYRNNNAQGATGLVMNAETGAILGMASFPSYNANQFATTDGERFSNPAISRQYEPGSVMKAFTIAAALDAGAITTRDTFEDDNNLELRGVRIQNADR